CAWRAVDPAETCLVFPAAGSSRLMQICRRENRYVLDLAERDEDVMTVYQDSMDIQGVRQTVLQFLKQRCESKSVRVSLIPFGPKPLIVGCLLGIIDCGVSESDMVYAIPTSYSANYSSGVDGVFEE